MSKPLSSVTVHAPSDTSATTADKADSRDEQADSRVRTISLEKLSSHPLFGTTDLIVTPQVAEVYGIVKLMVAVNDSGAFISAAPGAGKSSCLQVLHSYFARDLPSLVTIIFPINQQQATSIRAFFKGLLYQLGLPTSGETSDLRMRTFTQLTYLGHESSIRKILFLIDEAHRMEIFEFQFLKDVYNSLALNGVSLITVMAGQTPDLSKKIIKLSGEGRQDIIGRFASREIRFRKFETPEDVERVFDAIDSARDSQGTTWTEFFCPQAFSNGFRLSTYAERFYENWRKIAPSNDTASFTARPFFRAIRYLLIAMAGQDAPSINPPDELFTNAILAARLTESAEP